MPFLFKIICGKYSIYLGNKIFKYSDNEQKKKILEDIIKPNFINLLKYSGGITFTKTVFMYSNTNYQDELIDLYIKEYIKNCIQNKKALNELEKEKNEEKNEEEINNKKDLSNILEQLNQQKLKILSLYEDLINTSKKYLLINKGQKEENINDEDINIKEGEKDKFIIKKRFNWFLIIIYINSYISVKDLKFALIFI